MRCFGFLKPSNLFKPMSDGTPIDALESGDVTHAADASRVQAILQDMNASGAEVGAPGSPMPQQPQMMPPMGHQMPPMMSHPMMAQHQERSHYVPIENARKPMRKNIWSSMLGRMQDPLFVSLLVFVLSLPVLHVFLGKYASWAFAVGGQLSWLGLITLSLLAGVLFGTYKTVSDLIL
jgi:hypothetical protein